MMVAGSKKGKRTKDMNTRLATGKIFVHAVYEVELVETI